jgi:hypothetical protein
VVVVMDFIGNIDGTVCSQSNYALLLAPFALAESSLYVLQRSC